MTSIRLAGDAISHISKGVKDQFYKQNRVKNYLERNSGTNTNNKKL
jgi:hypothetical protein